LWRRSTANWLKVVNTAIELPDNKGDLTLRVNSCLPMVRGR